MGDTIGWIIIGVLSIVYFFIFHSLFDVYYFGLKGILGTLLGCIMAAVFTFGLIGMVLIKYWWLILLFLIGGGAFYYLGSSGEGGDGGGE